MFNNEIIDDASILTSDIDENIINDNQIMWMTILSSLC